MGFSRGVSKVGASLFIRKLFFQISAAFGSSGSGLARSRVLRNNLARLTAPYPQLDEAMNDRGEDQPTGKLNNLITPSSIV